MLFLAALIPACKKEEPGAASAPPPATRPAGPPVPVVMSVSPAEERPRVAYSGITFIVVPAGSFTMGSPVDEPGRGSAVSEIRRPRTIDSQFALSECEITRANYYALIDPASVPSDPEEKMMPMSAITWGEAVTFCRKLSENNPGKTFRLPTEIEWEYACRAGDHPEMYAVWKGGGKYLAEALAAFTAVDRRDKHKLKSGAIASFSFRENSQSPRTVGSFAANAWGFHDMHGNVWEWCDISPDLPSPRLTDRPIRGGSYLSGETECRAAGRAWQNQDKGTDAIGFRVLLENP